MWYSMTMLGFVCLGWFKDDRINGGNPYRLINAMDYNGAICGYDSSVKDKPVAYYMLDGSGEWNNHVYMLICEIR
jgi:hypothetical protein